MYEKLNLFDPALKISQKEVKKCQKIDKKVQRYCCSFSGIELVPLSGGFIEPEEVIINKPFIFIIRDKVKKVPLFVGSVMDPTQEASK